MRTRNLLAELTTALRISAKAVQLSRTTDIHHVASCLEISANHVAAAPAINTIFTRCWMQGVKDHGYFPQDPSVCARGNKFNTSFSRSIDTRQQRTHPRNWLACESRAFNSSAVSCLTSVTSHLGCQHSIETCVVSGWMRASGSSLTLSQ